MLLSYIKIAGRHFIRQRLYSLINVAGLGIGLTCSLLIALYVLDELSYDRQHPDAERIYRFSQIFTQNEEPLYLPTSSPQVGPLLKDAFPEVESFTRVLDSARVFVNGAGDVYEERVAFADASVFDFFALRWVQGNPATALTEPNSIVVTRSFARKYFGDANSYGQTLLTGDASAVPLRVTGLVEDLPHNMHFVATAFISLNSLPTMMAPDSLENWGNANFATYLKLLPGVDHAAMQPAFAVQVSAGMPEAIRRSWDFSGIDLIDIHLYAPLPGTASRSSGNLANVLTLSLIALGLLLLAGINFVNLSSARSLQRSKEVAVRKVMGSSRVQLFSQFMGESLLMVSAAFLLALVLVELALPSLNAFTGKQMAVGTLAASLPAALMLLGTLLAIAFLAGCYPALYLSALRPADPATRERAGVLSFHNVLVVFQFAVSIVLVIAAAIVYRQVQMGRNIDVNFNKDQLVIMEVPRGSGDAWPALRNELRSHAGVAAVTASSQHPFKLFVSEGDVRFAGGGEQPVRLTQLLVEYGFFETYEVELLAGREFSEAYGGERLIPPTPENPAGTAAFVLNRAAVEALGWSVEDAVGKTLERDYSRDFSRVARGPVIGVVDDMRFDSLRDSIRPMFYVLAPSSTGASDIAVRVSAENLPATLAHLDAVWKRFYPERPVNRSFLDAEFQALYAEEEQFVQLLSTFAGFSILISCMGLFGLTAFAVERRTREIGVRKVMGSSVWGIVLLLTNDFSRLVLLANLIAWPVAYLAMSRWLENFAYRIDLTPLVFIGSGLIALCIAWVTVGGTAAKAAAQKPVLALRYE